MLHESYDRSRTPGRLLLTALLSATVAACGGESTDGGTPPPPTDGSTVVPDGGPRPDAGFEIPDSGPRDAGDVTVGCNNPPIAPPASGRCTFTDNAGTTTLLRADVIAAEGLLENAHVLVGANGKVVCAACDCSGEPEYAGANVLECPKAVISAALINSHDHITFTETPPTPPPNGEERYDHRHDWRTGSNNGTRIPSVGNRGGNSGVVWGELRNLMAGATSINGSGGAAGLLRNLDRSGAQQEGLQQGAVYYSTFPLGDTDGRKRTDNCDYASIDMPTETRFQDAVAYTPHIAEGIEQAARNEFLCLSGGRPGEGADIITPKTAVIHGIGLLPPDYEAMALDGTSLIWSPRSNVDLYGMTANVVNAARAGVRVALGTDWTATGSMNMLRELRCADELNSRNYGTYFSDRELVEMATLNAAAALGSLRSLGVLAPGREADITIFDATNSGGYRAILNAQPAGVLLVLRSGRPLYGNAELLEAFGETTGCEVYDVCGSSKRVCAERETGSDIATHRAALPNYAYDLFFCAEPPGEPTCVPFRSGEFMGIPTDMDADGDGVIDAADNCPTVFNPSRPLDRNGAQSDVDNDMVGDACDPCPTVPGLTGCSPPNPNDPDGDGVPALMDNCPDVANMDQADRDGDRIGDACDQCPDVPNPGGSACPASIYQVKQAAVVGSVRINDAIVTAVAPRGYFIQVAPGDAAYDATLGSRFSGVFVFNNMSPKPARGDRVDVDGAVTDFFGQTQLTEGRFTVRSSGNDLPPPVVVTPSDVITGGARAADHEGVLVEVRGVTVTMLEPPAGAGDTAPTFEFVVTGGLRVNDLMYRADPFPRVGDPIAFLTGVLRFANDNSKLEPRDANDFGAPATLSRIEPSLAYVPAGTNGPAGGLAVVMTRPALTDLTITLASNNAGLVVPGTVTIPMGQDRVAIPVNAPAPLAGPVTLTATYSGVTVMGTVVVFDDAAPRQVTDLSLASTTIPINGSTTGTLELDLPGAVGGTVVSLSVTPLARATVPATVTVPEGQFGATFTLTTNTSTGAGTLSAAVGPSEMTAAFSVTPSVTRPPMPGDLMITEVHRNPSAANEHELEWFEVFNSSTDSILVNGMVVADNAGMATLMAGNAAIPPGGYAVIAYSTNMATNGGVTAIAAYGSADLRLANGADRITLSYMGMTLDLVDWGTGWPGGGQGTAMCLRFPYAADNNVPAVWANSVGTFGTSMDRGHPGVASNSTNCP